MIQAWTTINLHKRTIQCEVSWKRACIVNLYIWEYFIVTQMYTIKIMSP